MDLPRSTFYYRASAAREALTDAHLVELIGRIQDELTNYGYRRVTHELRRRGYVVNHKRVARVIEELTAWASVQTSNLDTCCRFQASLALDGAQARVCKGQPGESGCC